VILAARNAWPSAALAGRRMWPVALLVACAAVFAWRTDAAIRLYEPITTWSFLRRPVELVVIVVVTFGGAVLLAWRVGPPARRVPVWRPAAVVLAAGLLLATPVGFTYNDGCNDNTTQTALALVPAAAVFRPENAALSYDGLVTLMACPTQ
jgi:hypothetical protein